jgi:putative tricarboxylic transport membrane protein
MNRRNIYAGLFWLVISVFVCIESVRSGIGAFHSPGPGFLPFWSAVILGSLAVILVVRSSLEKKFKGKTENLWKGLEWKKVIWVLFSLFLYPYLLPIIGYLITTFGLIVFLLCIIKGSKVWIEVVTTLLIVLVSYVIFYILLGISLPKGIFGF